MRQIPLLEISRKEWEDLPNKMLAISLSNGGRAFLQVEEELPSDDDPPTHFNQCEHCGKEFPTIHGLHVHQTRHCPKAAKTRSKNGKR